MILYHTSYMVVEQPDLEHSRDYLDFGKVLLERTTGIPW